MSRTPKLYFVRHGETDWNAAYRLQGQRDIPINAKGRKQAARNGESLLEALDDPSRFDYIASPMSRTRETMNIVRRGLGLPAEGYRTDDRLKEVSYGDWEGFTFEELSETEADRVAERKADKFNFKAPRGESYRMLLARVESFLPYVENDSVIVCHGGIIRVLRHMLEGMDPEEAVRFVVPQDEIYFWDGQSAHWI